MTVSGILRQTFKTVTENWIVNLLKTLAKSALIAL